MKISEIVQKLLGIEQRLDAADKTKATLTTETLASLQSDFAATKKDVEGKLTQSLSDLETAQASIRTLTTEQANLVQNIVAACVAVKVEGGDEAKIKALTPAAQISALQTAVSGTLAKLNVDATKVPAAAATQTANAGVKMARAEFEALSPKAQTAFFANGGKLTHE